MAGFVNIHGQPINFADEAYRERMRAARALYPQQRKPTVKNGYAASPGTGPEGKTCGDCKFKHSMRSAGGAKHFIKCDANKAKWTRGEGSDILARSPACRLFQPKEV